MRHAATHLVIIAAAAVIALLCGGLANAVPPPSAFAPVNRPGPALSVPQRTLDQALVCKGAGSTPGREQVLLLPGSSTTPEQSYGWNLIPAFDALGIPYCTLTVPKSTTGDIQVAGEYVVHAIRTLHARSGKRVEIVGWSQGGGPMPRWALRWWQDTRPMVDNLIGVEPPNRGTATGPLFGCTIVAIVCPPSTWQQMDSSNFVAAMNSGQMTFPQVRYTVIYNQISNVVQPNLNGYASALPPGPNVTNIALQDFCGGWATIAPDHAVTMGSPATLALVLDTLAHPGVVADPDRVDRRVCAQQLGSPYVSAATQLSAIAQIYANAFRVAPLYNVPAEPPLRCYVYAVTARPTHCAA
ncbi:esterase/lipase family protein [Gordonia sp. NPDC003424]